MLFHKQNWGGRVVSQGFIILALILTILPLVLIVIRSMGGQGLQNYFIIMRDYPFFLFLANSFFVSTTTVGIVLFSSMGAAFALDVLRPRGSLVIAVAIMSGLALPSIAVLVPVFAMMDNFGLINTFWAVIVPLSALSVPFGVLLTGNHLRGLPSELFEAAKLDGATSFQYLVRVLLPLSRPILAVVAIFTFLTAWNEYLLPLVFLQNLDMQVAAQVPSYFQGNRSVDVPKIFAANVLISLPVLVLYIALQAQFRKGLSGGAIK